MIKITAAIKCTVKIKNNFMLLSYCCCFTVQVKKTSVVVAPVVYVEQCCVD